MKTNKLGRVFVVALIAAMLGGAWIIVARNEARTGAAKEQAPTGFYH